MGNTILHVAHKLWIMGGVLTLVICDYDKSFKCNNNFSMISINGPTIPKLISTLIHNWKHLDREKYDRVMKQQYLIDENDKKEYMEHKTKPLASNK